jgi:hypothetical protein
MGDGDPTELAAVETATESVRAWGLADWNDEDDPPTTRLTSGRITGGAVAASLVAVAVAVVLAGMHLGGEGTATPTAATSSMVTAAPAPVSPSAVLPPPRPSLPAADEKFLAELRSFGVPVSDKDPGWTLGLAHAVCDTVHDSPSRYPVGTSTVINLIDGVAQNNPDWSRQQASRFTNEAVDTYCPGVRGPSQQKIAKMAPDTRYLAMLQDRLGITPVDDSLVGAAHQVCVWKEQGWWNDKIVDAINSSNSREDEQVIVETAITVYCPQYGDR